MPNEPDIQHWLVSVARAAAIDRDGSLDVSTDQPIEGAWDLVAMATGTTPERLAELVAAHYGLRRADLTEGDPHGWRLVPASVAQRLTILPLRSDSRSVVIATADPVSMGAELQLTRITDRAVTFEVAPPGDLVAAIRGAYPSESTRPAHDVPPLTREARGGPRVLVVDDDAGMRLLLRSALEADGFRVAEAGSGPAALELLESEGDVDLITLDLEMEPMHGLEVLRKVRSRLPTAALPVVVATGQDDPTVELSLFEAGADDYVVKPVDPPRFLLRIRAVLRRRSVDPLAGLI